MVTAPHEGSQFERLPGLRQGYRRARHPTVIRCSRPPALRKEQGDEYEGAAIAGAHTDPLLLRSRTAGRANLGWTCIARRRRADRPLPEDLISSGLYSYKDR